MSWEELYCHGEDDPSIPGDVSFTVTDKRNPEEKRVFKAHKLLLGVVSPFWRDQFFQSSNEETTTEVNITDTTPNAFERLLKFIYLGEAEADLSSSLISEEASLRQLFEVLVLADSYDINDLRDLSKSILMKNTLITEVNLFTVACLCNGYSFEDLNGSLKKLCKNFLSENIQLHGHDFIQKIISQDNYDAEVFKELMKMKEVKRSRTSIDSGIVSSLNTSVFDPSASATSTPNKKCRLM